MGLSAQASLTGTVTDETGKPVDGAVVIAQFEQTIRRGTTERSGLYRLDGLGDGEWLISLNHNAYCPTDPGFVPVYFPNALHPDNGTKWSPADATEHAWDFVMPVDNDHDGMGDTWESEVGLDTAIDDSADDPDGDGIPNLTEYQMGTSPISAPKEGCGCNRTPGRSGLLIFPLLIWGFRRGV